MQSDEFSTSPSSPPPILQQSQVYSSGYDSVSSDTWDHWGNPESEAAENPNYSAGENSRPLKRRRLRKSMSHQAHEPRRCLKDLDIYKISTRVDNPMILHRLALQLNIKRHEIQTALTNHRFSLQEAAHAVLCTWFLTQQSPQEAFVEMRHALIQAELQLIVNTVLDD